MVDWPSKMRDFGLGWQIYSVESYLVENEPGYLTDNVGSGGIHYRQMVKYLSTDFWNVLMSTFSLKSDLDATNDRLDRVEATQLLILSDIEVTPEAVGQKTAIVKAQRTGKSVDFNGGACIVT